VIAINEIGPSLVSGTGYGAVLPLAPDPPNAPITVVSDTDVTITWWVAPGGDGGSPITGYTVFIKQSDGDFTTYAGCSGPSTSCTFPISVLLATPYNLFAGSSVYAKVQATNAMWSSIYSTDGNGAVLPLAPDPPGAPITVISGTNVVITWAAPAVDGGSPITGYTVLIRQSDGVFKTYAGCSGPSVSCTFPISVLLAAPYNLGAGYIGIAKVLATNFVSSSSYSYEGNGALVTAPSVPAAPTTKISGSNVEITWVAPAQGSSTITGYTVLIR
jgi:hypothetical protein